MKRAQNIVVSMWSLALMVAPAIGFANQSRVTTPGRVVAPRIATVSGWITVDSASFAAKHVGCSAIAIRYESEGYGPTEVTHGTGNAAAGTCYYTFEIPNLKWPDAAVVSTELHAVPWGRNRTVVVKPGKSVSLNFSRSALKYP